MLVKLKTSFAYRGETLNVGEIIAVDNVLADSLFLNGYATPAYVDDDEDDYEHCPLQRQDLVGSENVDPLQEQELSQGEGIEYPEGVSDGVETPENTDEVEESPLQEPQSDVIEQSETQEVETIPLGRSGKAATKTERNGK